LVKLGTIAVDGTKLRANASKHKAMSSERMQAAEVELKAQIDALLARAAQADKTEVALADAGYRSEATLVQLSESGIEVIVALGREGKRQVQLDAVKLPHTAAMAAKLQTDEGRSKYRRRKAIVESPNAWVKQVLGFRQFIFRGIEKDRSEFKLVCAAANGCDEGLRRVKVSKIGGTRPSSAAHRGSLRTIDVQ
jgi:hypothetical protein